ncbi:hypothetical protein C9J85_07165 [Haloferax sp. wsp5]|nr:hypothetical protein C9J85_07165 [Haloferax sp. wsp5]
MNCQGFQRGRRGQHIVVRRLKDIGAGSAFFVKVAEGPLVDVIDGGIVVTSDKDLIGIAGASLVAVELDVDLAVLVVVSHFGDGVVVIIILVTDLHGRFVGVVELDGNVRHVTAFFADDAIFEGCFVVTGVGDLDTVRVRGVGVGHGFDVTFVEVREVQRVFGLCVADNRICSVSSKNSSAMSTDSEFVVLGSVGDNFHMVCGLIGRRLVISEFVTVRKSARRFRVPFRTSIQSELDVAPSHRWCRPHIVEVGGEVLQDDLECLRS